MSGGVDAEEIAVMLMRLVWRCRLSSLALVDGEMLTDAPGGVYFLVKNQDGQTFEVRVREAKRRGI